MFFKILEYFSQSIVMNPNYFKQYYIVDAVADR